MLIGRLAARTSAQIAQDLHGAVDLARSRWIALSDKGLGPRAIFDRLRLEHKEFDGSHSAVKRLYRGLNKAKGVQAKDVAIPVETGPGEVAHVDFGYVGKLRR